MGRHGENIRKRKDGRWEARVLTGYDEQGKARYHSIYAKSYSEVKERRTEWIRTTDLSQPLILSNTLKITVAQLMNEWLYSKQDIVKESTYVHYTRIIQKHINPVLGSYYLSAVTTDMINSYLRQKLHSGNLKTGYGLSPKTVADIRSIILQAMDFARYKKYPCIIDNRLFFPRSAPCQISVFSLEEQMSLEKILYCSTDAFKLGVLLSLYSGLRIGELCALQWKDIHFNDGTLRISKTIIRIQDTDSFSSQKTKLLITHPKTNSSYRIIPLPSFILKLLLEHKQPPDYYLLTASPQPMEPRSCLSRYKRLLRISGVKPYSFHTLRHTFATRCIENGFDAKTLSEILGHASVTTTLQRYVHPSMDIKRAQMERLEFLTVRT